MRDYSVFEDGQRIGRVRFASERSPGVWLWHIQVHIPGPPFGSAASLDEAKRHFRANWLAFKSKHGPQALAAAYRAINLREALIGSGRGAEIRPKFAQAKMGTG